MNILTACYIGNKNSIIDVRLVYTHVFEKIEIFKVKLTSSKSSRLLQRVAFLVYFSDTWEVSTDRYLWSIDFCELHTDLWEVCTCLWEVRNTIHEGRCDVQKVHTVNSRIAFSRFFYIRGNLGNVKEKRIFIFFRVNWLKKSDFSSLYKYYRCKVSLQCHRTEQLIQFRYFFR